MLGLLHEVGLIVPLELVTGANVSFKAQLIVLFIYIFHRLRLPLREIGQSSLGLTIDSLVLKVVKSDLDLGIVQIIVDKFNTLKTRRTFGGGSDRTWNVLLLQIITTFNCIQIHKISQSNEVVAISRVLDFVHKQIRSVIEYPYLSLRCMLIYEADTLPVL